MNKNDNKSDSFFERKIIEEVEMNKQNLNKNQSESKNCHLSNLSDLLYKLDYNTDMVEIINTLNVLMREQGLNTFKKDEFSILLGKEKLDKFFKVKKVHTDFSFYLKYSLLESKK